MFDVTVRFLDGACEKVVLAPKSSIASLRSEIAQQRGLTKFQEVRLLHGTEELHDDGHLEVALPIQAVAKLRLNLVGSGASPEDVLRLREHWVFDDVRLLAALEEEPIKVEVQAAVAWSFSNMIAAIQPYLEYGEDEDEEQYEEAMAVLEAMPSLDLEQSLALLDFAKCGHFPVPLARLGQVVGRLCHDWHELVPQLIETLEGICGKLAAAAALATAAASSPSEKWPLRHEGAEERIHAWATDTLEKHEVEVWISPAIVLLGATGTSKSLQRPSAEIRERCSGDDSAEARRLMESLDLAQKLCLAREQAAIS